MYRDPVQLETKIKYIFPTKEHHNYSHKDTDKKKNDTKFHTCTNTDQYGKLCFLHVFTFYEAVTKQ